MTGFFCCECDELFRVPDTEAHWIIVWSLSTGDGALCPNCDEGLYALSREGCEKD